MQAAAKRAAAQARHQNRLAEPLAAEAALVGGESGEGEGGTQEPVASAAGGTHAADMKRLMLAAREKSRVAREEAAAEAVAADALQKETTRIGEDGVKYRTRADGVVVKIVRKPCPEGTELVTAVSEMATAAGWSEFKLRSRIGRCPCL